ncbi:hypothetical protein Hte_010613 [Hypoxylon texense]
MAHSSLSSQTVCTAKTGMMNPYESDPAKIPAGDLYANVPFYGRYFPRPADFGPDEKHVNSTTPESLSYWSTVLAQCTELNRIYENG